MVVVAETVKRNEEGVPTSAVRVAVALADWSVPWSPLIGVSSFPIWLPPWLGPIHNTDKGNNPKIKSNQIVSFILVLSTHLHNYQVVTRYVTPSVTMHLPQGG